MKKIFFGIIGCLFCFQLSAQQSLWGNSPVISPEVHQDKTVTFRLFAPKATKVQVTGDFLPVQKVSTPYGEMDFPGIAELKKNEKDIWEFTTPSPLLPELYGYSFLVDDFRVLDPANIYQNRDVATYTNIFLIEGDNADLYKVNNISHGTISKRWYHSPVLNMDRRITIYTPPGYETSNKKFPVLYLLHGMGGDEEAWMSLGRASQIADNLIARGKATPMIVVMPNGNVSMEAAPGETSNGLQPVSMFLPKTMEGSMEESFPDIVNFIDNQYRTINSKSGRAIAGLSMGGFHSLHTSKQYPDMFDYIGLFSAAIMPDKNISSPVYENMEQKLKIQFDKKPALYWIAIGNKDFLFKANEEYRQLLDKEGFNYTYMETEEGHIWKNWRKYLTEFLPMLFKK